MTKKDLRYYLRLSYPVELLMEEDGRFFARHPDLPGCVAEGDSANKAIDNLFESRALWIESRLDDGYHIPEPDSSTYSGKLSLRMSSSLHASLSELAKRQDVSLNLLINTILAERVGACEREKSDSVQNLHVLVRAMTDAMTANAPSPPGVSMSRRPPTVGAGGQLVQLDDFRSKDALSA